jgi:CO/xanthine dehydrogenase Mo-binding subunit
MTDKGLSRRRFTQSLGVVVASFALAPRAAFGQAPGALPFSLRNNRRLEGWIRLEADETVTVFTGKAELGQGILTALAQITAEELDVGFDKIRMVSADTSRGPDEQYTFGSQSLEQSGSALRAASAQARGILLAAAARRFSARPEDLHAKAGIIASPDGKRATFWEVASADPDLLKGDITVAAAPKKPSDYSIVGMSINRIDLPGKLTGAPSYVQDLRLPGMVFARVLRPPRYGAKLVALDEAAVRSLPGVVAVVRDGNFLAVAAKREEQAIAARNALASAARWSDDAVPLPDITNLRGELQKLRAETIVVGAAGQSEPVPDQVKRVLVPRIDRPLLRGRMAERRPHVGLVPHARRVSTEGRSGQSIGNAERSGRCRSHVRSRMLRPQRCRRRGPRRGPGGPCRRGRARQASVDAGR